MFRSFDEKFYELEQEIKQLKTINADLLEALEDARDAIASLPFGALGWRQDGETRWPIRNELLDKIIKAIRKART